MKYNKIISAIILLFFVTTIFGQKNIENSKPQIKSTKILGFNKNNYLGDIIYKSYNLEGKLTNFTLLNGDSTQIMRYSHIYDNKGLLKYENHYRYEPEINTDPEYRIEYIYNENGLVIQKRTFSDYKTKEIFDDNYYLSQVITDLNSGKITSRELYIYDNDLLIEIRFLDKKSNVYRNELFKYNKLNQKVEEIHISNNRTNSKYKYEYNNKGKVIKKLYFREKKAIKKENTKETEDSLIFEVIEEVVEVTIGDTEQSYPEKWKDWEEEETYQINTYAYNTRGLINIKKIEGQSEYNGILKNTFEYDEENNWIKKIMNHNDDSLFATITREIEYY